MDSNRIEAKKDRRWKYGIQPKIRDAWQAGRLGEDYGKDNEATIQAGFLVTDLMRQLGYELSGKNKKLPSGCVAKTGQLFVKSSR